MNPYTRLSAPLRGGAAAALALILAGCGRPRPASAPAAPAAVVVEAVDAVARDVPVTLRSIGHLDASAAIKLVPLVNARIDAVLVSDGSDVKAGDPLVRFDSRGYAAQLARMRAEKAAAAAQVEALRDRIGRSRGLVADGFVSAQDAQEQQASLAQAEAALAQAEAGLEQAAGDMENCEPKAPFDGRIGLLSPAAVVGGFVAAGSDPLLELRALDSLKVDFTVPESALPLLQEKGAGGGLKVMAWQHGDPSRTLEGPVAAFDNAVDPQTRSIRVRAVVPNPGRRFWPGQFVDVEMIVGTQPDAVLVPYQAINTGPNGPYLYVIKDGKAALTPVGLGAQQGDLIVITSGVAAGQKVIVSGQLGLQDGSPVQVSTAAAAPASP